MVPGTVLDGKDTEAEKKRERERERGINVIFKTGICTGGENHTPSFSLFLEAFMRSSGQTSRASLEETLLSTGEKERRRGWEREKGWGR